MWLEAGQQDGPTGVIGTDSALKELTGQQLRVSASLRQAPPRGDLKYPFQSHIGTVGNPGFQVLP